LRGRGRNSGDEVTEHDEVDFSATCERSLNDRFLKVAEKGDFVVLGDLVAAISPGPLNLFEGGGRHSI